MSHLRSHLPADPGGHCHSPLRDGDGSALSAWQALGARGWALGVGPQGPPQASPAPSPPPARKGPPAHSLPTDSNQRGFHMDPLRVGDLSRRQPLEALVTALFCVRGRSPAVTTVRLPRGRQGGPTRAPRSSSSGPCGRHRGHLAAPTARRPAFCFTGLPRKGRVASGFSRPSEAAPALLRLEGELGVGGRGQG